MTYRTYAAARQALERDETSCEALVAGYLKRIAADNERINAFLEVDAEGALEAARRQDAARAGGQMLPLSGMVLGVKDVICIRDRQVTCGSHILDGFRSLFTATAVERLTAAGAIAIGKLNCDEFAMGSTNENSYFGPVRNPVKTDHVPGGSSGGSAAAVAADLCQTSLGSDTGGSVRQPAAYCGTVGLKPTYGRISRYGLVAFASSFDCIGPMGRSVDDVARLLQVMAGQDTADATSAPAPVPDYRARLNDSVRGLRIGIPAEYFAEGLDPEIRDTLHSVLNRLEAEGAVLKEVSLPLTEYGIAAYYVLTTAEASSNLARYDGVRYGYRATPVPGRPMSLHEMYTRSRSEGFGEEVKRRIMLGTYVLSSGYYDAYYEKARKVRALVRDEMKAVLSTVDVLATPASPTVAPRLGELTADPLTMYLSDVYTVPANLAGIPGLVVPVGASTTGLPIGLQLLGNHFDEETLLRVGESAMRVAGTATE